MTAGELWYAYLPGKYLILEINLKRISPFLWDPVMTTVLLLPAWLILGLPGILMIARFRPRRATDLGVSTDPHYDPHSMFLFDELAARAREEGYSDDSHGDDMAPRNDVYDPDGVLTPLAPEDDLTDLGFEPNDAAPAAPVDGPGGDAKDPAGQDRLGNKER